PLKRFRIENLLFACRAPHLLRKRKGRSPVSVSHADENRPRLLVQRQLAALRGFGAAQEAFQAVRLERVKDQHTRARKKRGIELEGGVLRRGAHKHDSTVLHHRQEGILLSPVEAMDLVHEEERLASLGAPQT